MPKQKSQADLMVELALAEDVNLFVDQYNTPYIQYIETRNPHEIYKISSLSHSTVKHWLAGLLYSKHEKVPGGEATNSALNVLKAKSREGPKFTLYNRVAPDGNGGIYIDMADYLQRAIHVTTEGWKIIAYPPTLFRRYNHQKPLPEPVRGGDASKILEFANLKDDDHRLLFLVTTASYLIPEITHPIEIFHGPHGSGKSMAMRAQRKVVDPSITDLLAMPRNDREFVQQLHHHYGAFYDNVAYLPKWVSDVLCRAVTGTGVTKRALYTDDEDIIYQYRRCCGINGINIVADKGDLLDRAVMLHFDILDNSNRVEESKLYEKMDHYTPEILGGFLDILVSTLKIYPSVSLPRLYRMADFTKWGYAITKAMGLEGETFLKAYQENVKAQSYETLKASIVATVLLKFMDTKTRGEWTGEPTELYLRLIETAEELAISTKQKAWPKSAHWMTKRINDITPSLLTVGYKVESGHTGSHRYISILGLDLKNGVNSVSDPTNATNATNTTLQTFSKEKEEHPLCVECGLPINDGSNILWKGVDRICSRCASIRKKVREGL